MSKIRVMAFCENCGHMIPGDIVINKITSKITPASTLTTTEVTVSPSMCPACGTHFTDIESVSDIKTKEVNIDD